MNIEQMHDYLNEILDSIKVLNNLSLENNKPGNNNGIKQISDKLEEIINDTNTSVGEFISALNALMPINALYISEIVKDYTIDEIRQLLSIECLNEICKLLETKDGIDINEVLTNGNDINPKMFEFDDIMEKYTF